MQTTHSKEAKVICLYSGLETHTQKTKKTKLINDIQNKSFTNTNMLGYILESVYSIYYPLEYQNNKSNHF